MNKIKIFPEEQRIVILPIKKDKKTSGGIIIPDTAEDERPEFATVIVVGKGSEDIPMRYIPGDIVLCSTYSGAEAKLNLTGEEIEYKILNQLDVMAKIEEVE